MNAIGIMQGRLSPASPGRPQRFPWSSWHDEFALARECGFAHIEWLVTAEQIERNPLWTATGLEAIARQAQATGVSVRTICADCFISHPLVRVSEAGRQKGLETLAHLIDQASRLHAEVVLVPLLAGGAILTGAEGVELIEAMAGAFERAARLGIRIGIESDLPAGELAALVDQAGRVSAGAYYDLGNAAARGADAAGEIATLGGRLCGVHVKDRHRAGPSVSLGDGAADFHASLQALTAVGYAGPLILETPAGGNPESAARANLAFLRAQLGPLLAARS